MAVCIRSSIRTLGKSAWSRGSRRPDPPGQKAARALRGDSSYAPTPPRTVPEKSRRRSSPRSQRVSVKGMWNTTRGVPKKVTLGGAGAPKCAPSLPLSRGTAGGAQGPFPARVSRRRELETRSLFSPATRVSGSPAPFTPHPGPAPRAPSSFSQLFRGSP